MLIKICGITSEADALLAVAMGADAIGFVFAPSHRQIAPMKVADIVKRLPRDEVLTVGVFRDESPERVVEITHAAGLRVAQLHGRETPEQVKWIRQRVPMVIKAFVAGDPAVSQAEEYGADLILLDAAKPGSGKVFDWALASDVPPGQRFLVAGGLNPENVAAAVARSGAWGVDVSSGVETSPGQKDPLKMRAFITAARSVLGEERFEPRSLIGPPDHEVDLAENDLAVHDVEGGAEDAPFDWQEG